MSDATRPPNTPMTKTKILYLGSAKNFDRHTAKLLLQWLYANTGNRGLIVVHPKAES